MERSSRTLKTVFPLLMLCVILFTGCSVIEPKEETQVDTDTLCIMTRGRETAVYDLVGDGEYHFKAVRTKRENAPQMPQTAAETETVEVILLPGGDIEVTDKTAGKTYTVHRGR